VLLIGAKIVSIGTSLPELTIDLFAAKCGRFDQALGDIIGSNLTNLTLVLELVLLFSPYFFNIRIFTDLLPFLLVTTIILWRYLTKGGISQAGGIILIMIYILFQAVTR
jgi:cation:H+ antiporter